MLGEREDHIQLLEEQVYPGERGELEALVEAEDGLGGVVTGLTRALHTIQVSAGDGTHNLPPDTLGNLGMAGPCMVTPGLWARWSDGLECPTCLLPTS